MDNLQLCVNKQHHGNLEPCCNKNKQLVPAPHVDSPKMANSKCPPSKKRQGPANKGKAHATKTNQKKRGADGDVDEEVSVSVTCRRKKAKLSSFEEVNKEDSEVEEVDEVDEVEILEPDIESDEVRAMWRIFIFTKLSSYLI
jgi:hypothetical protein